MKAVNFADLISANQNSNWNQRCMSQSLRLTRALQVPSSDHVLDRLLHLQVKEIWSRNEARLNPQGINTQRYKASHRTAPAQQRSSRNPVPPSSQQSLQHTTYRDPNIISAYMLAEFKKKLLKTHYHHHHLHQYLHKATTQWSMRAISPNSQSTRSCHPPKKVIADGSTTR